MKRAVILFNLGGPDKLESVEPFLFNLFNDPAIISIPSILRYPLAKLISNRRAPVAKKIYQELGGSSPILKLTKKQSNALETKLKAVYLVRLGEFISWPTAFASQDTFTLCIAKNEPIYLYLAAISQYKVKDKPLHIINTASLNPTQLCHILYSDNPNKTDIHSSTLIVGSQKQLIQQGGVIRFYIKDNKIRMQVNLKAAKKKGLTISSQLLRLMEIIEQ
mgnify:CR=1 FL=1